MHYLCLIFLAAFLASADGRLEPVGAVRESLSFAIELPNSRVCVLTPQRLALLASADATEVLASHWTSASSRPQFAIHKGHAFVANWSAIEILRIDEAGFTKIGEIELRYAWMSPLAVANDQLFVLQSGRELNVFTLADISEPVHLRSLRFSQSGSSFVVGNDRLYMGTRGKLTVYDIRKPAEMPELGEIEWPISRVASIKLRSSQLHASSEGKYFSVDVSDPQAMTLAESERPKLGSRPLIAIDVEATWEALFGSGLWTRRPLLAAARVGSHLVFFDGVLARVYDIAEFATPRLIGSCEFSGSIGKPAVHGQRIYTVRGVLDLGDPAAPAKLPFPNASVLKVDGDTLYHYYGRTLTTWSLAGEEPTQLTEIKGQRLEAGFIAHEGLFYHADEGELRISQLVNDDLETVGTLKLGGDSAQPLAMMLEDGLLYVGTQYKGVRLVDVRDPAEPRLLASLAEDQRFEQILGVHGMAFGSRGNRELVGMNLRRKMAIVERGPRLGRGFLEPMGDYLLAATPEAGVGIYSSDLLKSLNADLRKQAPLRAKLAKNPEDLAVLSKLAMLCDEQGDVWEAERYFAALEGQELDADMQAAVAAFVARRKADAEAALAAAAFESDLRKANFGDVERDEGRIVQLRIFKPKLIQTHMAHLATLPLRTLEILQGPIRGPELQLIRHFPKLKRLRLRETAAEAADFAPLATLTELEHLNLEDARLPADALAHIAKLSALEYLDLESTGTDDAQLAHVAGLTNLNVLDLEGCPITDAGLAHLSELRKLTVLCLEDCRLNGEGFQHLVGLTQLENLDLEHVPAASGYAALKGMNQLEDLDLDFSGITNSELAHLAGLKRLKNLQLGETAVGSEGVAYLAGLGRLTTLDLSGTSTDDAALLLIGRMSKLENLDLRSTAVSDDGVAHLAGLVQLEWLGVESIPDFSNAGLKALSGLKSLRRVSARFTSVTAAGAAVIPQAELQWKDPE
ncbi:MAG: Leucine-rich repeat (LRR) protein, partial [Rhodothermales bacterium]